jgi:hypothetical protein
MPAPTVAPRWTARDLPALKRAMAAAYPDRGGTAEQFIAARAKYLEACRTVRGSSKFSTRSPRSR